MARFLVTIQGRHIDNMTGTFIQAADEDAAEARAHEIFAARFNINTFAQCSCGVCGPDFSVSAIAESELVAGDTDDIILFR